MRLRLAALALAALSLVEGLARPASADPLRLPDDLASAVASESAATALAPLELATSDFALEWEGQPPPGVRARLEPESLEWVRVSEVLAAPRAQLVLEVEGARAGVVTYLGYRQPLAAGPGATLRAALVVALLDGPGDAVELRLLREGGEVQGRLHLRYRPPGQPARAARDVACSAWSVELERRGPPGDDWAYLGCRQTFPQGPGYRTAGLELYLLWSGAPAGARLEGLPVEPTTSGAYLLRPQAGEGGLTLEAGGRELRITYRPPERVRRGRLGLGLGPYFYETYGGRTQDRAALVLTLYGSYALSEVSRLVLFDATALSSTYFTDLGAYWNYETARLLDRRVLVNLMLGAHAIAFGSAHDLHLRLGIPQGVEFIARDVGPHGYNLSTGGFVYPLIAGVEYYNLWVRWGTGRLFVEANYLSWREVVGHGSQGATAAGLCVGFPVATFL